MLSSEEATGTVTLFSEPKRETLSQAVSWMLCLHFLIQSSLNSHNNPVGKGQHASAHFKDENGGSELNLVNTQSL